MVNIAISLDPFVSAYRFLMHLNPKMSEIEAGLLPCSIRTACVHQYFHAASNSESVACAGLPTGLSGGNWLMQGGPLPSQFLPDRND